MSTKRMRLSAPRWAAMLVLAGGCGGGMIEEHTASQDHAVVAENGIALNGLELNGTAFNGMKFNGLKYNTSGTSTGTSLIGFQKIWLEDSRFHGDLTNGKHVHKRDLDEAQFQGVLADSKSTPVTMRIHDIDQQAEGSDVFYYELEAWDVSTKSWKWVCPGKHKAVPVSGYWDLSGSKVTGTNLFTFACVERGAIGKCIQLGYKPWVNAELHQACVRMVRADYCGDGKSHTVDGNVINVYDRFGIQRDTHTSEGGYNWTFEADWTAQGAKCFNVKNRPSGEPVTAACWSAIPRCSTTSTATSSFSTGVQMKTWLGVR